MSRLSVFAYSLGAYGFFLGVFLYLVAFLANLRVAYSIDVGRQAEPGVALLIDLLLILLFGLQHSIMARPAFKRWIERYLPPAMERSTYVLIASLVLALLMWQWRPLPTSLWQASGVAAAILWAAFGIGWGVVLLSTFLIDHFDLFGLRQAYMHWVERPLEPLVFRTTFLYRLVRHPIMLGFLIAFWFTPQMTIGHLLFAAGMTIYIVIGVHHEERDLVASLGSIYDEYRSQTPAFIPGTKRTDRRGVASGA